MKKFILLFGKDVEVNVNCNFFMEFNLGGVVAHFLDGVFAIMMVLTEPKILPVAAALAGICSFRPSKALAFSVASSLIFCSL